MNRMQFYSINVYYMPTIHGNADDAEKYNMYFLSKPGKFMEWSSNISAVTQGTVLYSIKFR